MSRASWYQDETDQRVEQLRADYRREQRRARIVQWSIIVATALATIAVVIGFVSSG